MNDDFEYAWDFGDREKYKSALKEIAKPCPILFPEPNRRTHLFVESTNRRQEIAEKIIKGERYDNINL